MTGLYFQFDVETWMEERGYLRFELQSCLHQYPQGLTVRTLI